MPTIFVRFIELTFLVCFCWKDITTQKKEKKILRKQFSYCTTCAKSGSISGEGVFVFFSSAKQKNLKPIWRQKTFVNCCERWATGEIPKTRKLFFFYSEEHHFLLLSLNRNDFSLIYKYVYYISQFLFVYFYVEIL